MQDKQAPALARGDADHAARGVARMRRFDRREGGSGRPSFAVVRITPRGRLEATRVRGRDRRRDLGARGVRRVLRRRSVTEALELGEGLEGDPAFAFRRTLGMFATGVTVLTTRVGEQVHGMTANAFMSVSLQPPLVLVSIDRRARMGALLHEGTRFGVSVLEAKQTGSRTASPGGVADDLPEATFELVHETPLVEGALAHLVARVVRSYWGGDHSLFLGQVEFARYGEGRRCCSTGAATSGSSRTRASSRCSRELLGSDPRPRRGARVRRRRGDHAHR